eukprot:scaffold13328_cov179-Alexandrium_tamarense.AAC.9
MSLLLMQQELALAKTVATVLLLVMPRKVSDNSVKHLIRVTSSCLVSACNANVACYEHKTSRGGADIADSTCNTERKCDCSSGRCPVVSRISHPCHYHCSPFNFSHSISCFEPQTTTVSPGSTKAPTVGATKAPTGGATKAPTGGSTKAPTGGSTRATKAPTGGST